MGHKNPGLGLLGALGIFLTAGCTLPLVNSVFRDLGPGQLMVFRGGITALFALAFIRKLPWNVDRSTRLIALALPLTTLGLFEGTRSWGPGPTMIVMAATPVLNLAASPFLGRTVRPASIVGLALVLAGVVLARWSGTFCWNGLAWSAFAMVANAALYELFARATAPSLERCVWGMGGMVLLGFGLSFLSGGIRTWAAVADPLLVIELIAFAFVGGFLYWISYQLTFENLPVPEASMLAQGQTLGTLVGAWLLLGERLTWTQGFGVFLALAGAAYLSVLLKKPAAAP